MALTMRYASRSDVGLVRAGNEDSGYAGPRLLLVADGMGGHAAGELASAVAVATLAWMDSEPSEQPGRAILRELEQSLDEVGQTIGTVIEADPELAGMGTTATGLYWLGDQMAVAHVGDSRAYVLRNGRLSQITKDHTYVQTLIDSGRITHQEAASHPRRNLLMRAIDGMGPVEADVFLFDVEPGDRFLLCSDGLSGVVDSDLIAAVLGQADPTGAVTQLVDFALERGAPDNVTVVVADVVRVPDEMATNVRPTPVVVGAAAETRVRLRLPYVSFPADAQPDPDRPDAPPPTDGPPTAPQPLIDADLVVPASQSVFGERDGGAPRRRGRLIALVAVLVVMGLALSTGLLAANSWRLSRWYLGVNGANVAVYHGIPGAIGPIPLSDLVCDSGIPVALLPEIERSKVQGSQLQGGRADIVARLSGLMSRLPAPMVDAAGCAGLTP